MDASKTSRSDMLFVGKLFICLFMLFSLPSCGFMRSLAFRVMPPYTDPAEGPRAKIRVVYQGSTVWFYPGDACFNPDSKDARAAGPYAGFVRPAKRLDMPLAPARGKYDEFYVRADVPLSVSFYYESETLARPDQKQVERCGPVGFTFTPTEDAMYETRFEFISKNYCGFVFEATEKDEQGAYKKRRLPALPASLCPRKPETGGATTLPSGTAERERRYF